MQTLHTIHRILSPAHLFGPAYGGHQLPVIHVRQDGHRLQRAGGARSARDQQQGNTDEKKTHEENTDELNTDETWQAGWPPPGRRAAPARRRSGPPTRCSPPGSPATWTRTWALSPCTLTLNYRMRALTFLAWKPCGWPSAGNLLYFCRPPRTRSSLTPSFSIPCLRHFWYLCGFTVSI